MTDHEESHRRREPQRRGPPRREHPRREDPGREHARREGEISYATRKRLFLAAAAALAALLVWGLGGLPDFGDYRGPYGILLNEVAVPERHATAVVSAINFDYRGFDTLGEEFILFAAVLGLALLLREGRDEELGPPDDDATGRRDPETSAAVRVATLALVGPTVVLSVYIVAHGHLTPGGGSREAWSRPPRCCSSTSVANTRRWRKCGRSH